MERQRWKIIEEVRLAQMRQECSLQSGRLLPSLRLRPCHDDEDLSERGRVIVQFLGARRELVGLQDERHDIAIGLAGQTVRAVGRHERADAVQQLANGRVAPLKRKALLDETRRRAVAAKIASM